MFENHGTNEHTIMMLPSAAMEKYAELTESLTGGFDLIKEIRDGFPKANEWKSEFVEETLSGKGKEENSKYQEQHVQSLCGEKKQVKNEGLEEHLCGPTCRDHVGEEATPRTETGDRCTLQVRNSYHLFCESGAAKEGW